MPNVYHSNHVCGSIVLVPAGLDLRTGLLAHYERDKPAGLLVGVPLFGFHAQVHRVPNDSADVLLHGSTDGKHSQRSNQCQIKGWPHGQLQSLFPIQAPRRQTRRTLQEIR